MHNKDLINGSSIFVCHWNIGQVACTCSIYRYGGGDHLMVLDLSKIGYGNSLNMEFNYFLSA
jgi:hypothetical protein